MADTPLHVAIAAGGTAGHINPALALADELVARGAHVTFYGQPTRLEATLVPEAGFDFVPIEVSGFDRARPWTLISALVRMAGAERELKKRFEVAGAPDVAIGFGAYVELPLLRVCAKAGIPTLIHEQNSVIGLANKTSAKKCTTVCVAMPAAIEAFKRAGCDEDRIVVTGNPVRKSVISADRSRGREAVGAAEEDIVLLIFGGSLGAHHVNEAALALKDEILAREGVHVVHATGAEDFDWAKDTLGEDDPRWQLSPYITDMGDMLAAADLVLSRAGASSIAEIAATAKPSILVPYPHATADHQTTNAHFLVDAGAARLVADDELDNEVFRTTLLEVLDSSELRAKMRSAAATLPGQNSAAHVADCVEKAAGLAP